MPLKFTFNTDFAKIAEIKGSQIFWALQKVTGSMTALDGIPVHLRLNMNKSGVIHLILSSGVQRRSKQ
jgi:hypothetical protein